MDINSKIYLENNIFICLKLKDGELEYELDDENYEGKEEPYDKFNVYEKNDAGNFKYKNIFYKRIKVHYFQKDDTLKYGHYLFTFNKINLFIEFMNNKISYELEEYNGIEEVPDLK